jgi:hypothetical protein
MDPDFSSYLPRWSRTCGNNFSAKKAINLNSAVGIGKMGLKS